MTVIAVDFDGCLCESRWPDIGPPREAVIEYLKDRQKQGDKLILWTCREGELLAAAVMWCMRHGLKFDAVNRNLPERIEQYGNDCRKVGADEYWDDRAVIVRGLNEEESEIIKPELSVIVGIREEPRKGLKEWILKHLKLKERNENER